MGNTDKLKVLFLSRAYSQRSGGMERLSWELIHELSQHPDIEAHVLAYPTPDTANQPAVRQSSILFALKILPRAITIARSVDVVHLGDPALSFVGWLLQRIYAVPVAVTVHGLDITYQSKPYQMYLQLFFTSFDGYLPISHHVQKLLSNHRITGTQIILNPGVYDRFFDPTIDNKKLLELLRDRGYDFKNNQKLLLTCGRLIPRKGHEWFIKHVLPSIPRAYYVIAGEGPEYRAICAAAQRYKVDKRVAMLGRVTENDLKTLYNTADIFVQPNIAVENDVEGFGLVLLEAALCKRPIVAARINGITDAIHDGKNGVLIESNNAEVWISALTTFIEQPQAYPVSTQSARAYTLAEFSWDKIKTRYIKALQAIAHRDA